MLKGLGDVGNLLKLQKEFKNTQKRITGVKMTGESADGDVKATVNGEYKVVDLLINPDFIGTADVKALEKAVAQAVNSAVDEIKNYAADEMGKLTGGMDIPGLSNFLK